MTAQTEYRGDLLLLAPANYSLGFGFAAHFLLFLDESSQLLTECHIFTVGLLDEGMLQDVGHRWTSLKILYKTP